MFEDRTMLDPSAPPPAVDLNQTQQAPEMPYAPAGFVLGDATQQAITATCPVCKTPNSPGERWCMDCGFLLSSTPADVGELPDASTLPRLVAAFNGGREFALSPGENSVGRENSDVLLPDPQVSRQHARLLLEGNMLTVEDLGSTNGSHVAGRRLGGGEQAAAYDGDEVRFGGVTLRVVIPGGPVRPAEATLAALPPPALDRGAAVAHLARADGTQLPLYEGINSVGRRLENDVCLTGDPYVSGRHADVCCESGTITVIDLGSTNGTSIEGDRLPPNEARVVEPGTTLQFGKTPVSLALAVPAAEEADSGGVADAESFEASTSDTLAGEPGAGDSADPVEETER